MLKPAVMFYDQIKREMCEYYYTEEMFFYKGAIYCDGAPHIETEGEDGHVSYAIVSENDENKLLGFLTYHIDLYADIVYRFGFFSFDKGNPVVVKDAYNKLNELCDKHHVVEWRAVGGNPANKGYDAFINKRKGGGKHILRNRTKDYEGKYRDVIIYEIINLELN